MKIIDLFHRYKLPDSIRIMCMRCLTIYHDNPSQFGSFSEKKRKDLPNLFRYQETDVYYKFKKNCKCGGPLRLFIYIKEAIEDLKKE